MTNETLTVKDDIVVSLDYTLSLDDGEMIDSSEGKEPLQFLQGHGQIINGLEEAIYGMAVGDKKDVSIQPAEAYGETDKDAYQLFSLDMFPEELELQEGMGLRMRDSESGQVVEAYVAEIRDDSVVLDFNHPLAGETLHFQVHIADLRPATDEELDHGHVHGPEGTH